VDTILFVYLGDPGYQDTYSCDPASPAPALACDDDGGGICARLGYAATDAGTYYIRVVGMGDGCYTLDVDVS
jgi:hypothetical protein